MSDAPKLNMALLGFSSSGKSTFTNSMAGKRIVEMGMDRTTMVPHLVDTENSFAKPNIKFLKVKKGIWSDDKVPLAILDLAGITQHQLHTFPSLTTHSNSNNTYYQRPPPHWSLATVFVLPTGVILFLIFLLFSPRMSRGC